MSIEVLFEDDVIIVINKPPDFLSVPGKTERMDVETFIRNKYENLDGPVIVHRLDMPTSGIMILAKTNETYLELQSQFIKRKVSKRYVALLEGELTENEGEIELPIRIDLEDRPRQLVCYEYGKHSKTIWKKIEVKDGRTRVHFFPITGRTHQLRVHAAHLTGLNTPIVGDVLYGKRDNRLHLHAESLTLTHPITKKKIVFKAPAEF